MFNNFFKEQISTKLGHIPTASQDNAIEQLLHFMNDQEKFCTFILTGYAGTGKTSLISALINVFTEMKINTVLLAPTGRAAKVLSNYSGKMSKTIHKCIYRMKSTKKPESRFSLNFNNHKDTIFIVDEASMIGNIDFGNNIFGTGRLLDDLLSYVFNDNNCRLILIGDTAQLPPINTNISPALDKDYIQSLGMKVYISNLNEVVRQSKESGILANATKIREMISENNFELPQFETEQFPDIESINGTELLDELESCYTKFGEHETKVICRSNKYSNKYNSGIRNRIMWKEEDISHGDLLMVVKNNYSWLPEKAEINFIANGDIIEVLRIGKRYEIYNHTYVDLTVVFVDYPTLEIELRVLIDTLYIDTPSMDNNYYKELYQQLQIDYNHIKDNSKRHEEILKDPFFNALQVKFAYAITCHKSQGGQWPAVFIDHGWLNFDNMNTEENYEFLRWLYTAITRATKKLYLVNFKKTLLK